MQGMYHATCTMQHPTVKHMVCNIDRSGMQHAGATSKCVHHGSVACIIGAPHASSSPICTPVRPNARRTARSPDAMSAPNESQPGDWSVVRDSGTSQPTPPSLEQPTSDDTKTQPSAAARQLRSFAPTRSPTTRYPTFAPLAPTTQAPGAQKQVEELTYDPATNPSLDAWLRPLLNKPWAVVVNLPPNQQLTLASLSISDVANPYFDVTLRCSDTTLSTNLTVTNPIKLTQSSSKLRVERLNLVQESSPSTTAHVPYSLVLVCAILGCCQRLSELSSIAVLPVTHGGRTGVFAQSKSRVMEMSNGTATFTSCTFSGNSAVRTCNLCSKTRSIANLDCVGGIGRCMRRDARRAGAAAVWRAVTLVRAAWALRLRAVRVLQENRRLGSG
jgi:hypothetical protein